MSFLQPLLLIALPLIAMPIIIHLINQWRYQTRPWGAMMFLLQANRMNRGFAKLRQWLILAMRTLAVAGLLFAVARPLASGFLGLAGGGKVDTTIVILDRSPSMQQQGVGGVSKLETGRKQLADALKTLGATHWVTIDANGSAKEFDKLEAMLDSPEFQGNSATCDLSTTFQGALDYLKANKPGPTEIWICSDLRKSDWNQKSGTWSIAREGFLALPQSVGINLVAYPEPPERNLAIRVTKAIVANSKGTAGTGNELLLSMQVVRQDAGLDQPTEPESVTIEIEVDGARSTLTREMTGSRLDLGNHRIPLSGDQRTGWGRVSLPADSNNADNSYFFVFDDPPLRRVVVVSEDREATRAVEIAASISEDGSENPAVEVVMPEQVDSLVLDDASLLVWQTSLPESTAAGTVRNFVEKGGQVIFFPPTSLIGGSGVGTEAKFMGVQWSGWNTGDAANVMVENWRGDQDLLAATASGSGLPVGGLKLGGFATLQSDGDLSKLASLSGGTPLLARVPTDRGGVYFCATSASAKSSSLAKSGVVLFVAIQRAMNKGLESLGKTTARVADAKQTTAVPWQLVSGDEEALSTDYPASAGVYRAADQLFSVNRSTQEDQVDVVQSEELESLFGGLQFSRVDGAAGQMDGIVREIWRVFLIIMILALLLEAFLCLPRIRATNTAGDPSFGSKQAGPTGGNAGRSSSGGDTASSTGGLAAGFKSSGTEAV